MSLLFDDLPKGLYEAQRSKLKLKYPVGKNKEKPFGIIIEGKHQLTWDINAFRPCPLEIFHTDKSKAIVIFETLDVGEEQVLIPRYIYSEKNNKWYTNTR